MVGVRGWGGGGVNTTFIRINFPNVSATSDGMALYPPCTGPVRFFEITRPLDDESLNLDLIQSVDNHNSYSKKLGLLKPGGK